MSSLTTFSGRGRLQLVHYTKLIVKATHNWESVFTPAASCPAISQGATKYYNIHQITAEVVCLLSNRLRLSSCLIIDPRTC